MCPIAREDGRTGTEISDLNHVIIGRALRSHELGCAQPVEVVSEQLTTRSRPIGPRRGSASSSLLAGAVSGRVPEPDGHPDAVAPGYFPPREYATIMAFGFEPLPVGAPAPTISIVLVTAGNELIPAGAFVDQITAPVFVESA